MKYVNNRRNYQYEFTITNLIDKFNTSIPGRSSDVSLRHHVQTDSGAHSAFCPMRTGTLFPGGKAVGAESSTLISISRRG